jgi:hypothetical protein
MALNIRNGEAHRLAAELAALAGEPKTDAVICALRERLVRLSGVTPIRWTGVRAPRVRVYGC